MILKFGLILLSAIFLFPKISAAQTLQELNSLNLEDLMKLNVVSGASKYEQKVSEAPADVTVISSEEIRKAGFRNLYEILNSVRGIYMSDDRNYNYIGIRGFNRPGDYNGRVLLTIDGHRINDNVYDSVGFKEDSHVFVPLIERIEIIRGPASSLYGSNGVFGVINVITKSAQKLRGTRMSVSGGSFGTSRGSLIYAKPSGKDGGLLLSIDGMYANGAQTTFGALGDNDKNADSERSVRTNLKYKAGEFGFQAAHYLRYKAVPSDAFGADFGANNHTDDERYYLEGTFVKRFSETLEISSRTYYDVYRYQGDFYYSGVVNTDLGMGSWWGQELRVTSDLNEKHKLVVGVEFRNNLHQDQKNYDTNVVNPYLVDHRSSISWGLFGQDEWRVSERWLLLAGLRLDKISYVEDAKINPRASAIFKPSDKTSFKFMVGQAFRAPNQYELYFEAPVYTQVGNPNLKPEVINTYEIVWGQTISPNLNLDLSGFYYRVSDLINQETEAGNKIFRNSANDVIAKGLEADLKFKINKYFTGNFAVTVQNVTDEQSGNTLSNSPQQLGKLNLSYRLKKNTWLNTDVQYISKTDDVVGNSVSSYSLVNLGVVGQFNRRFDWNLRLANVLNQSYSVPVGDDFASLNPKAMPQDGINGEVKLTYRF